MRQLASLQIVRDILPIPEADRIELVMINDWEVVSQRGLHSIGDLVIYCEIDSWIPTTVDPTLSKGKEPRVYEGIPGERLRTIKLRGQRSQGLILPLRQFPHITGVEGDDVTEILGIIKYDPPVPANLSGVARGNWPSKVPKTDEERIQNCTRAWPKYKGLTYEVTEKLEGSSMTVALMDQNFIVCSRNVNLQESEDNLFWRVARKNMIYENMRALDLNNIAIQGELVGEGVQGNIYKLVGHHFYVYSMFDITTQKYIAPADRIQICNDLGLNHVPVLSSAYNIPEKWNIKDVLVFAEDYSVLKKDQLREGLVFKQVDGEVHWKAISNVYLEKHK